MPAAPTAERVRELLSYDPATGEFRWRVSYMKVKAGDVAGCRRYDRDGDFYIMIKVDGRMCCAHQLAWLYMTGEWPSLQVDHKNRVKHDNRWENLRQATDSQNKANRPVRSTSKTGVKGVKLRKQDGVYEANITVNGRPKYLGRFSRLEDAEKAYIEASRRYHGEFSFAA